MKKINANSKYAKKVAFRLSGKGKSPQSGLSDPTTTTITTFPTTSSFTCFA